MIEYQRELIKVLDETLIEAKKSCYNELGLPDPYCVGLYNGIEMVRSLVAEENPKYIGEEEDEKECQK